MKGLILGLAGLSAVGTAAYVTGGKKPVDDFVGIINKSPGEVYAALSAMGPDGVTVIPTGAGPNAPHVSQKITKENGKSVRVEVMLDDKSFASVEFQLEPAEGGRTRIAGEVDLDMSAVSAAVQARGGPALPTYGMAEGLIDRAFAMGMERVVQQINDGEAPVSMLALGQAGFTRPDWGSDGAPSFGGGSGSMAAAPTWSTQGAARSSVSARPSASTKAAVDPNRAVQDHLRQQQRVQEPGW